LASHDSSKAKPCEAFSFFPLSAAITVQQKFSTVPQELVAANLDSAYLSLHEKISTLGRRKFMQHTSFRYYCKIVSLIAFTLAVAAGFGSADAQQKKPNSPAETAPAQPQRFDFLVREDFFAGMAGDQARFNKGMKFCEETLAKNPQHPEALVWHGGGLLFQAGAVFQKGDMQKGGEMWQKGLDEMSAAVKLQPENISVLIPRAASLFASAQYVPVPGIAQELLEIAVKDYEKVFQLQQGYFKNLSAHARGELLIALAAGWHRLGNPDKAREYFLRLTKEVPSSPHATTAQTWLEKKTLPARISCAGCHA
jgi:tetratricopeptide (TPR) repeat protein